MAKKDKKQIDAQQDNNADAAVSKESDEFFEIEAQADAFKRIRKLNEVVTKARDAMDAKKDALKEAKGVYENAVSELSQFIRACSEELPLFEMREYQKPIDAMLELTAEQMRIICWRYHNPTDDQEFEVSGLPEEFRELKKSQILKALEDRQEYILDELNYPQSYDAEYHIGYARKPQTFEEAAIVYDNGVVNYEALFQFVANCIPAEFVDVLEYMRDECAFVLKFKGKKKDQNFNNAKVVRANSWNHPDKFNLVKVEAYSVSGGLKEFYCYFDAVDSTIKTLDGDVIEMVEDAN